MERTGILFDFDGTLSPLHARREHARIRGDVEALLKMLAEKYVLAVVSSKDCVFLLERAPGFHSYVCVNGLEILTDKYLLIDSSVRNKDVLKAVEEVLLEARKLRNVDIEEKKSLLGILLGLSIDWRGHGSPPEGLGEVLGTAAAQGLYVVSYKYNPFADIYVTRADKGEGVRALKLLLELDNVVYIGDGENDIPAFKIADVAVLVRHESNQGFEADVDYEVRFEELGKWLASHVLSGSVI
uniref:HAD-IIB family hydrolase n=1 Tax=Ignisphaera aggregans TaxID=334771 RepID=A0A7C2VM00_9CREN